MCFCRKMKTLETKGRNRKKGGEGLDRSDKEGDENGCNLKEALHLSRPLLDLG